MKENLPTWIIFDGDNTLWSVEPLYDKARSTFCENLFAILIENNHESISVDEIEAYQRKRDKELYPLFGYSSDRFARSFEDTVSHFLSSHQQEQIANVIKISRGIAKSVFRQSAEPFPGVEELLLTLKAKKVRLGLLTAGEQWVQQKRCRDFPYTALFDWLKITPGPKNEIMPELATRYQLPLASGWFVGDSLFNDVIPAIRIGLNAIWIAHPNWDGKRILDSVSVEAGKKFLVDAVKQEGLDPQKAHLAETLENLYEILEVEPRSIQQGPTNPSLLAYGIFEGGGAKGLAHIGAYHACDKRNIKFLGVAGTSAGSIVAGLIAVGYNPDQLFRITGGGLLDEDYDKIIGHRAWDEGKRFFKRIEGHFDKGRGNSGSRVTTMPRKKNILALKDRFVGFLRMPFHWLFTPIRLFKLYFSTRRILRQLNNKLGYLPTEGFRNWYNDLLLKGYREAYLETFGKEWSPNPNSNQFPAITFAHIDLLWRCKLKNLIPDTSHISSIIRENGCPLKIVSTDVGGQRLCLHPDDSSMDLPIADAVAASIAIPFVFQAKELGQAYSSGHHVDGGTLSNFPTWIFRNRLGAFGLTVPILGFELVESPDHLDLREHPDVLGFARGLISTVVAGSKRLSTRLIPDLYSIPVKSTVSAYAFDQDRETRRTAVEQGFTSVLDYFKETHELVTQEQFEPRLKSIYNEMQNKLGGTRTHLRVNLVTRNILGQLHIRYRYNMEFDTDDYLHFEHESAGGVGLCWKKGEPVVVDLEDARQAFMSYQMSKYEQALVRPTLRSLLSVPIFDPRDDKPSVNDKIRWGILNFDSDDDLCAQFREPVIQQLAAEKASDLALMWVGLAAVGRVH